MASARRSLTASQERRVAMGLNASVTDNMHSRGGALMSTLVPVSVEGICKPIGCKVLCDHVFMNKVDFLLEKCVFQSYRITASYSQLQSVSFILTIISGNTQQEDGLRRYLDNCSQRTRTYAFCSQHRNTDQCHVDISEKTTQTQNVQ